MGQKWTAIIGAAATIGLFLLTNAKRLADAISIIHLPHDVGEFLIAMSEVPALISYGALSIGIICLAYLVASRASDNGKAVVQPAKDGVWKSAPDAVEAFTDVGLVATKDKWLQMLHEAHEKGGEAEDQIRDIRKKLNGNNPSTNTEEWRSLALNRRRLEVYAIQGDLAKDELRRAWDALRDDIENKLTRGLLMAKGFRVPHIGGGAEVEISPAEWRVLDLNNVASEAIKKGSNDILYSGLVIRRTD